MYKSKPPYRPVIYYSTIPPAVLIKSIFFSFFLLFIPLHIYIFYTYIKIHQRQSPIPQTL